MRIQATPNRLELSPGLESSVQVEVFNSSSIIVGYQVRAFGVDPSWVSVDGSELSLFPETSGIVTVTVRTPRELPVGVRDLTVEVSTRTEPVETQLVTVGLDISADRRAALEVVPGTVNGGSRARFGLVVHNQGNAPIDFGFSAVDGESALDFDFRPTYVTVPPGQQTDVELRAKGRRPLVGNPAARPFVVTGVGPDQPVTATGVFLQKPRLPRAAVGMLGLLAAITVFAAVITTGLGRVVDRSKADSALALEILDAQQRGPGAAPGTLTGTVRERSTGDRVSGLTVEAAAADNPITAVASTATSGGTFTFSGLPAGDYVLRLVGAGFAEQWYPGVPTVNDAQPVAVDTGGTTSVDVLLSALPGRVRGRVIGADPAGATVTAAVAAEDLPDATGIDLSAGGGVVTEVTVSDDGSFDLAGLPAPFDYVLEVSKEGYASQRRPLSLAAGQFVDEVQIPLRRGDGEIRGTVLGLDAGATTTHPIGGATITATDGETFVTTSSLTTPSGDLAAGDYILRDLPVPATYSVTVEADGFGTETFTVSVSGSAQGAGNRSVTLRPADGVIRGEVTSAAGPLGGVLVVASDGQNQRSTTTDTADGSYVLGGLPVPASYTVTFTRDGYGTTSRAVALDAFQNQVGTASVRMIATTGSVSGTVGVRDRSDTTAAPSGGVVVTMTSGAKTLQTVTADVPASEVGTYRFSGVPTGSYSITFSRPGSIPVVLRTTVEADAVTTVDADLEPRAAMVGIVVESDGQTPVANARIRLYRTAEFPATVLATTTTSTTGEFEFADLDGPERYTVTVARTDTSQEIASGNVQLGPGEQRSYDRQAPSDALVVVLPASTAPTTTTTTTTTTSTTSIP